MKNNTALHPQVIRVGRETLLERSAKQHAALEAKIKDVAAREKALNETERELGAIIDGIEAKGRVGATAAASPSFAISDPVSSIADLAKQLHAIDDPSARAAFYSEHAGRFGLEPAKPAAPARADAPHSRAEFIDRLNAFTDASERGAFYAAFAPSLGF